MAAIPVTIVGTMTYSGLEIGGGPAPGGPSPMPPIYYPPSGGGGFPSHPWVPPLGIWGGAPIPVPTPPIYYPPSPPLGIWGPPGPWPTPPIFLPPAGGGSPPGGGNGGGSPPSAGGGGGFGWVYVPGQGWTIAWAPGSGFDKPQPFPPPGGGETPPTDPNAPHVEPHA